MATQTLQNSNAKARPALRLVGTKQLPREYWLAVRKQGIGSSDAAAAVGLNPYKSQLELWLEKTGRDTSLPKLDPNDEESPAYWGNILEPIVATHYTKRSGHRVRRANAVLQHPDPKLPWMLANIDREVTYLELKAVRQNIAHQETREAQLKQVLQQAMGTPDGCSLAQGACKPYGRLNVVIGDEDPLGSFVFRTTGFNSIRTLAARLQYFQAISGNRLACLPLELRLRGKSTRQSHGTPIFYVDITVRSGLSMQEALLEAKQLDETRQAAALTKPPWIRRLVRGLTTARLKTARKTPASSSRSFFPALRPCTPTQNSNRQRLQKHHWPKSWNRKPADTQGPASSKRAPQSSRIRTGRPS